jgi:hypothetical protein
MNYPFLRICYVPKRIKLKKVDISFSTEKHVLGNEDK